LPSYSERSVAGLRNYFGVGFSGLALAATVFAADAPAVPQATAGASPARQTHRAHGSSRIDDRVKMFAKSLDLNEAQQAAVKRILEQRQQQTLEMRLDPSITGSVRIERFRALQVSTVQQIRAVLNDEQSKKYDPLAPGRLQPAPDQRSVEDWLKITTPK
jgi:Spy/CpxP family protein refolding chaperone